MPELETMTPDNARNQAQENYQRHFELAERARTTREAYDQARDDAGRLALEVTTAMNAQGLSERKRPGERNMDTLARLGGPEGKQLAYAQHEANRQVGELEDVARQEAPEAVSQQLNAAQSDYYENQEAYVQAAGEDAAEAGVPVQHEGYQPPAQSAER